MTPNLRYNKKITSKLINAIPKAEDKVNLMSVNWNIDNKQKIYGLIKMGWFKSTVFYLQKIDEERFRLVVSSGSPLCHFYIIDDINEFMKYIGVQLLDFDNTEDLSEALEKSKEFPNTGIIVIENGEIYVYDHENY